MKNIYQKNKPAFISIMRDKIKESAPVRLFQNILLRFAKSSLKTRAVMAILLLTVIPAGTILALMDNVSKRELAMYLSLHFSLCIAFCLPLANWLNEWLVNRELRNMNKFCVSLKHGRLDQRIELFAKSVEAAPDELTRLQQNLNWLAHTVAKREYSLTRSLAQTNKDKERLNLLSYTDHLTGLFNKRFFELKLVEACSKCISCKTPLHLMLIDCDHFKEVNDLFGHQEGDKLLARLGQIIDSSVRGGTDFPFRFGGDEFGAILVGVDSSRCEEIAERIRRRFADLKVGRASLSIGISKLCCQAQNPETEAESLISTADKALYFAKNTGRDKVISPAQYKEIAPNV
ncbi:GGDEF domain-containing protein [Maridesulfovibrio hydrothermalis]|uniref:diguanylate cyclase n=1 Tax=Maridesulfovibrio hydrothermalis AM13 = DSM 14728 TaxID=1121451 RepID=L0R9M3_9BACT|nr:GGDEF domain-containing protein [Maridesulfovibrio hydrothermalis]CCO22902.1 Diguanylate cyclase [Maridesulfovibrio hydrothermalis AM13 = DSM 14728]